jgi:hypothetical protein
MNLPGFTGESSLSRRNDPYGLVAITGLLGQGDGAVRPARLPSWWCQVFPWLCAVCGECRSGLQSCCEPGGVLGWNCYVRRC